MPSSQHSGLTNGAIAAALVGVLAWVLTYWHVTVPDQIQNDAMVLFTWAAGYLLNDGGVLHPSSAPTVTETPSIPLQAPANWVTTTTQGPTP